MAGTQNLSMAAKLMLFFVIRSKGHITKMQLVKFLYLADLYSVKWHGTPITELKWYYYLRGPWEKEFDVELDQLLSLELINISPAGKAQLMQPGRLICKEAELVLPMSMKLMLDGIRIEWTGGGTARIKEMLDYVYKTAPMRQVLEQGFKAEDCQALDLNEERKELLRALEG